MYKSEDKSAHYIKNVAIESLFQEDLQEMLTLNSLPYEIYLFEPRKTDNYTKVTFDNNLYSSALRYAKTSSDKVWVLIESYEVIMQHPRMYGDGLEPINWLSYVDLMSKRPAAMKYT